MDRVSDNDILQAVKASPEGINLATMLAAGTPVGEFQAAIVGAVRVGMALQEISRQEGSRERAALAALPDCMHILASEGDLTPDGAAASAWKFADAFIRQRG